MNIKKIGILVVIASIFGGITALTGYHYFVKSNEFTTIESMQQRATFANFSDTAGLSVPAGLNFIYAAELTTPAVVHIKTTYMPETTRPNTRDEELFRYYYGDPYENYNQPREASGSGVIVTAGGYIVTNNHVVEKASKIQVVLNDKRTYDAKLIGTDPTTDLALIKIEGENLPYITYGNSDNVRVGEWVLAVGNPFNLTSTVTAGIISAKTRSINLLRDKDNMAIESFLQTDAVVNPGNSGGALVNLRGELIGINTAIASPTGAYAGYSFAVPVALVKKVIDDIMNYGQVQRGLLGVVIQDMTTTLAKEKSLDFITGVYVSGVNQGSAADLGGIKEGDIITKINDINIGATTQLQEVVARYRPGDKLKVRYIRKGTTGEANVVLKNKLGDMAIVPKGDNSVKTKLGADLQPVSGGEMSVLEISGGAKVAKIFSGKLKEAGVREGFIITSIDKKPVSSPEDVIRILEETTNGGILMEGIYPNGKKEFYGIGW
ncbi:Do family serine endopeptidase [Cytophaga aurantiaca]|uniref:Do family serine endopeptidase n=1 Tax=Cytophaga aurantiaca TaxID=29530 RepID=UPI0003793FF8|nr:Do family serine endopeptidase [Cytophaga aurantiaca]